MIKIINRLLGIFNVSLIRISKDIKKDNPRSKDHLNKTFSFNDEESYIHKYSIKHDAPKYCVDIGASDGITMSNSHSLFLNGWTGLAIECDSEKFSSLSKLYSKNNNVALSKCRVTPENVLYLLNGFDTPSNFGVLSIDIDGYDYFVIDKILTAFRPFLIVAEINEKIPPPIKFTVNYSPEYSWNGDHFYGQSISQLFDLCIKYRYDLVRLIYNNAFLIPTELNTFSRYQPETACNEGYFQQENRKEVFPWNLDMEEVLHLPPQAALYFINKQFNKYEGKYDISISH